MSVELPEDVYHHDSIVQADPESVRVADQRKRRRISKRTLPKTFLFLQKSGLLVLGAMLVRECRLLPRHPDKVSWTVSRAAMLAKAFPLVEADWKYMSNVFELQGAVEVRCRLQSCQAGGSLNSHFAESVGAVWKTWSVADEAIQLLRAFDGSPITFTTSCAYATAIGVTPDAAEHAADEEGQPLGASVADDDGNDDGGEARCVNSSTGLETNSVRERLHSMSKKTFGAVARRFTPDAILQCLDIASDLKPGASLANNLGKAAAFVFGVAMT